MSGSFSITPVFFTVFIVFSFRFVGSFNETDSELRERVISTISTGQSNIYGGDHHQNEESISSLVELLKSSGISEDEIDQQDPESLLELASKLSTSVDTSLFFKSRRRSGSDAAPNQCEDDSPPDPARIYFSTRDVDDENCHSKRLEMMTTLDTRIRALSKSTDALLQPLNTLATTFYTSIGPNITTAAEQLYGFNNDSTSGVLYDVGLLLRTLWELQLNGQQVNVQLWRQLQNIHQNTFVDYSVLKDSVIRALTDLIEGIRDVSLKQEVGAYSNIEALRDEANKLFKSVATALNISAFRAETGAIDVTTKIEKLGNTTTKIWNDISSSLSKLDDDIDKEKTKVSSAIITLEQEIQKESMKMIEFEAK